MSRPPSPRLWRQHRVRRAQRDAHLAERRAQATAEPGAQPCVRRRARPPGARGPRDDASAGAGARPRALGRARDARRSTRRDVERQRHSAHPGAGFGRRLRRPRASRAPRARADRARAKRTFEGAPSSRAAKPSQGPGSRPSCSRPKRGSRSSTVPSTWRGSVRCRSCERRALATAADIAGAMSLEALKGIEAALSTPASWRCARTPGKLDSASNLRRLLDRQRDHGEPSRLRKGAGRVFAALHAAGARRDARCARDGQARSSSAN